MTDDLDRRLADAPPRPRRSTLTRSANPSRDGRRPMASSTSPTPPRLAPGSLTAFVTPRGLVRLSYPGEPIDAQLGELADRISPRVLAAPERTDAVRRQLDDYFAGAAGRSTCRSTGAWW